MCVFWNKRRTNESNNNSCWPRHPDSHDSFLPCARFAPSALPWLFDEVLTHRNPPNPKTGAAAAMASRTQEAAAAEADTTEQELTGGCHCGQVRRSRGWGTYRWGFILGVMWRELIRPAPRLRSCIYSYISSIQVRFSCRVPRGQPILECNCSMYVAGPDAYDSRINHILIAPRQRV